MSIRIRWTEKGYMIKCTENYYEITFEVNPWKKIEKCIIEITLKAEWGTDSTSMLAGLF